MKLHAYAPPPGGIAKIIRIMKLTTLMLIGTFLQVSAKTTAQRVTISEKNVPLEKVFNLIEKQTGYVFLYKNDLLKDDPKVTIDIKEASLQQALALCIHGLQFTWEIVNKTIVVKKKPELIPEVMTTLPGIDVHGRVVNEKGEPVAGATVTVKGTRNGTATDADGYFTLAGVDDDAVLVISGVNIETFEIKVDGRADLGTLKSKIKVSESEEVVVNTGYQQLPKERVTGSFEKVDNDLFNRSVTTNVLDRLDGIVPGLIFNRNITNGGSISNSDISIRGISTLLSDQKPLLVVDNFPYSGDINNINPNDVESISVLKDAAATSIWGTRAGNGVIVITTKKGRYNQKMKITANNNITVVNKPDLYYVPQFTASAFIDVEKYLFDKGFYDADITNTYSFPIISPVVQILADNSLTTAQQNDKIDALRNLDVRKDYLKYLYRKAINQQYAINITGGSNNVDYMFSVGYDKNLASQVGNESNRLSIRSQTNFKPIKNLELQLGTVFTQANSQANSPLGKLFPGNGKNVLYPYAQLADANGDALATLKDHSSLFTDTAGNGKLLDWKYRPLDELRNADNTSQLQDYLLNTGLSYKLTSFLSADVKYQFEKQNSLGRNYYNTNTYFTRSLINRYTPTGGTATENSAIPYGGILDLSNTTLTSQSIRGQLNFNKSFATKHEVNAIAGFESRSVRTEMNANRAYGYNDQVITYRNVDYVNPYPTYLDMDWYTTIPDALMFDDLLDRFVSFYGNAAYTYDNRYTLSASARRDASNLFGVNTNNKWKPLWSAGGSWNISNETFYHSDALPVLKLRATYGYSGNVNNSITGVLTISGGQVNSQNNLPVYYINNAPNPNLRWEKARMINMGIDFSTKGNIISGSIEYYEKKSTDLISYIPADPTSGYATVAVNSAHLKGQGIDINIVTRNIDKGTFKWQTNWQFAHNTNKVTKYLLDYSSASSYINNGLLNPKKDQDAYAILSYKWAGLDPTNGNPMGYLNGKVTSDIDSISYYSSYDDLIYSGSARPTSFGAIRNTFSYKALSVSINITYRLGYYFRRTNILDYGSLYNYWIQTGYSDYVNRWQQPGDELHTNVPSMIYPANSNRDQFYRSSVINIEKGDNIRLQDINLSYRLDKRKWSQMPFQAIDFYLYANNIGLIWKANKAGLDPDYETPPPRSIAIGLKVDF